VFEVFQNYCTYNEINTYLAVEESEDSKYKQYKGIMVANSFFVVHNFKISKH